MAIAFLFLRCFRRAIFRSRSPTIPKDANTTAISVGYNIFNPTSKVNVGELLQGYGGGGHKVVGSCRVPNDKAEQAIKEICCGNRVVTETI